MTPSIRPGSPSTTTVDDTVSPAASDPTEPAVHTVFRRIYHGAEGGLIAGLAFILADMGWSRLHDEPATVPIRGVATVFDISDHLDQSPDALAVGIFTHAWLSAFFGMVFALLLPVLVPRVRELVPGEVRSLLVAGAVYGLALYVVNYQVLGRILFTWFSGPKRPDLAISVFIHLLYGVLLAPFFIDAGGGRRVNSAARA
jgi:hypothetical protein